MITVQINPSYIVFVIIGLSILLPVCYVAYRINKSNRIYYILDALAIVMAIILVLSDPVHLETPTGVAVLILMMSKVQHTISLIRSLRKTELKGKDTDANNFGSISDSLNN